MISIDTALLRELVSASSVANNAIDNAVDALNRVSTHNDWGCKEKYAINEYAITNRNKIKQLQENSRGFLNVITQVSNEFETSENSIIDLFSSVESLLSGMLSIPVSIVANGNTHTGTNAGIISGNFEEIFRDFSKRLFANDGGNVGYIETPDHLKDIGIYYMGVKADSMGSYTANNLTEPIAVCNFEDINLG